MRAMLLLLICCLVSSFTLPAVAAQPGRVGADLGLVELPVTQASSAPMVVFMSGDGGWAALDKGLSAQLQAHGMPVVGWSSLSYYWKKKTPDWSERLNNPWLLFALMLNTWSLVCFCRENMMRIMPF